MRRLAPLLLPLALMAAALPAAAQTTPRRPPADTLRFGATRPAAGDSIRMAEYEEDDEEPAAADQERASSAGESEEDTVPGRPGPGPYARAAGGSGPFSVQASGETARRPPRGEVVWLEGRAARAAADSARRDTARAGTGQRVASGQTARRDTSAASRPAARDTAGARRNGGASAGQTASAGRQGQSGAANPSGSTAGRSGSRTTTTTTTSGSNGRTSSTTTTTAAGNSGRTGSSGGSSSARPRSHTVSSGETFYGIARRYGVTAAQLRAVNPDVEMDALEVGDVLRLPASARDSRASSSGSQRTGSQTTPRTGGQSGSSAQRRTHTVVAGETLYGIARRYGVTVDAIREANDMEGDQVRTGQRLVIPPAR